MKETIKALAITNDKKYLSEIIFAINMDDYLFEEFIKDANYIANNEKLDDIKLYNFNKNFISIQEFYVKPHHYCPFEKYQIKPIKNLTKFDHHPIKSMAKALLKLYALSDVNKDYVYFLNIRYFIEKAIGSNKYTFEELLKDANYIANNEKLDDIKLFNFNRAFRLIQSFCGKTKLIDLTKIKQLLKNKTKIDSSCLDNLFYELKHENRWSICNNATELLRYIRDKNNISNFDIKMSESEGKNYIMPNIVIKYQVFKKISKKTNHSIDFENNLFVLNSEKEIRYIRIDSEKNAKNVYEFIKKLNQILF
ncbi:hypothetical protein [Campylobacter sp. RM12651]|uniref:hypothetical protein n=1 Tax=Campylobacter sp. RM12651 TaxID=1660079 RepID=UPI001EFA76C1|nr:hypothetical protein [Campylobacter sp. RM12651]ULO04561.1 hypothetical protein AVBRAN_a0079 [Campylobacter sp. RM12651]